MPISPGTYAVYTVRPGDSPYSIANQFGSSLADLERANALYPPVTDPGLIFPGQKLVVRVPGTSQESTVLHQVTEGDTLFRLAERYSAGVDMLAALNRLEQPDILRVAQLLYIPAFVYEVEAGDSLYRIARRFGSSISELARANANRPGFSPDVLYPGYRLVIPLPSSTNIVVFRPLPGSRIAAGTPLAAPGRSKRTCCTGSGTTRAGSSRGSGRSRRRRARRRSAPSARRSLSTRRRGRRRARSRCTPAARGTAAYRIWSRYPSCSDGPRANEKRQTAHSAVWRFRRWGDPISSIKRANGRPPSAPAALRGTRAPPERSAPSHEDNASGTDSRSADSWDWGAPPAK